MNQYDIYTRIEKHISFGIRLFLIDRKGKHIINEIKLKKNKEPNGKESSGKNILSSDMKKLTRALISILNVKKFTPRLYLSLIYFLDELLFKDTNKYTGNKFYIEDNEYELTKLYFDPEAWIIEKEIQCYSLDKSSSIDLTEAMCLICFLREYDDFLLDIDCYVREHCNDDKRLRKGFHKTNEKIRCKLKLIWDLVLNVIQNTIQNDVI